MCGIFGAVFRHSDRKFDITAAVAALQARGPDAQAFDEGEGYAFGHSRLAVIDLSPSGAQPMSSDDRRTIVVFNGEIFNYRALRKELESRGHVFRSRSDTEVILHGYRAWGADVVPRLDGMFAIGIFDTAAQTLLLARDRTGKKPIFYQFARGELRFASEPKALFASGIRPEVDPGSLSMLLSLGYVPAPWSPFLGVAQLPPASVLILGKGREPQTYRYWSPRFVAPPRQTTAHAAAGEVRRLFIEAVKQRLEADVPLGAFLSGGLDSTIVVGVITRLLGRKLKTFSLGFSGDSRYDETQYARQVARDFETEHEEFIVESTFSADLLDDLVRAHDAPFGDSSAIPMSIVSRLARRHVTVALTGDGGDDVFCGYDRFLVAEALERFPAGVLARISKRAPAFLPRSGSERSTLGRVRRLLPTAGAPLAQRLLDLYPYFGADPSRALRPELLSSTRSPLEWTEEVLDRSRNCRPLARVLDHSFETYLPYDLLVKADRTSMMHGLELRSPFLDTALIDYGSALADNCRRRFMTKKYILRRAFADIVPESILRRPKMGFGIPLAAWFRSGAKSLARERLAPGAKLYEFLDETFVSALLREHEQSLEDHSHRIWLLLTLETWLTQLRA
jgi:asparagine synthase (glutamine-hydrolysing)